MRKRHTIWIAAVMISALCAMPVLAEKTDTAEKADTVETADTAETADSAEKVNEQNAAAGEIEISFPDNKTVKLVNGTSVDAVQVFVKKAADEDWGTEIASPLELKDKADSTAYDIQITDGKQKLFFYNVDCSASDIITLMEKDGATWTEYKDAEQKDVKTAPVKALESPQTYYASTNVNMRQIPSQDGAVIKVQAAGTALPVYGESDGWYLVKDGEKYGYMAASYLATEYKAPAADSSAGQGSSDSSSGYDYDYDYDSDDYDDDDYDDSGDEVYVVSREDIPSCDDGSHGTTYIEYSDGTIEAVDY